MQLSFMLLLELWEVAGSMSGKILFNTLFIFLLLCFKNPLPFLLQHKFFRKNSDKPGHHDFEILKRLVLPDGSILRAKYPGRPSRDCLFIDPVMDGTKYANLSNYLHKDFACFFCFLSFLVLFFFLISLSGFLYSLLKIWNLNNCTGVIGVFNCQEAGIWPCLKNPVKANVNAAKISGQVSPADIEYFEEVSGTHWTGDCAVFSFSSGKVILLFYSNKMLLGV